MLVSISFLGLAVSGAPLSLLGECESSTGRPRIIGWAELNGQDWIHRDVVTAHARMGALSLGGYNLERTGIIFCVPDFGNWSVTWTGGMSRPIKFTTLYIVKLKMLNLPSGSDIGR
jgi:hypothetical protein